MIRMVKRSMFYGVFAVVSMLFANLIAQDNVQAQVVLYDGFVGPELDPAKWQGSFTGNGGLEAIRQISSGRLRLSQRVVGEVASDSGANIAVNRLKFRQNRDFTFIRFRLSVRDYEVTGCPENPTISKAVAGFFGTFFNDGSGGGNDQTGDIGAFIFAGRSSDSTDAANLLRVTAAVTRCADPDCSIVQDVERLDMGTIELGANPLLSLRWDVAGNQFIFRKNNEQQAIAYADIVTTVGQERTLRSLSVLGEAAHCASSPRTTASLAALFDNPAIIDLD